MLKPYGYMRTPTRGRKKKTAAAAAAVQYSTLSHVDDKGNARMVDVGNKASTKRRCTAVCSVYFSNPDVTRLIEANSMAKGDVLGVSRVAGIMAAKKCSDIIPLCHNIPISQVTVDLKVHHDEGGRDSSGRGDENGGSSSSRVDIEATVTTHGQTGVEMEALTAVMGASLTLYDMCKAVDRHIRIDGTRVISKTGGKHDF